MKIVLKHPYSGYWGEDMIAKMAALSDPPASREDTIDYLLREGFKVAHPKPRTTGSSASPSELVKAVEKLAVCAERIASGLETIVKLVPLLTPPIDVEKVAELAGVTPKTVYRWKEQGLLKPLADNKPLLFDQQEVHEFLRRRRRGNI